MSKMQGKVATAGELEIRQFTMLVREMDAEGQFTGYASVFGEKIPWYEEVVDRGAFKKTLQESKGRVPIFYMHDRFSWLGMGVEAQEDSTGFLVRAQLELQETQMARSTWALLKMAHELERPAGLSIGFVTVTDRIKDSVRHITELSLFEYSPTPPGFQAAPSAKIGQVRTQGYDWLQRAVMDCMIEMGAFKLQQPEESTARGGHVPSESLPPLVPATSHAIDDACESILRRLR